ncbi:MAG: PAS-domain containing protein [Rhizomicrobium sp.]
MHAVFDMLFNGYLHLIDWTSMLADLMSGLAHRATQPGEIAMASIVIASLLIGLFACVWAFVERARSATRRYVMLGNLARAQSEIRFREAMIQASPEAIVIMGSDLASPLSYHGGSALLQACLSGADSAQLAAKLEGLLQGGTPFTAMVRTGRHPGVSVKGCVIGSRAALFLRVEEGVTELERDLKSVLEALPVPVWIRNRKLALTWANRAFVTATGSGTLEKALKTDPRLVRAERDLAGAVLDGNDVLNERRYTVTEGRRRALSVDMFRLPSTSVAGVALDVTDSAHAEAQLKLSTDAYGDMLDRVDTAIAVFGSDRRLAVSNKLFAKMWDLSEAWLESHPALDDIFDRLRETRRLPEQRDFQAWKREHMRLFDVDDGQIDETWHIAGGSSVRVKAYPYLLGGVYYVFEDISETLHLNTSLHMLTQTQRATLDAIEDGMAVFGPDGRLKMHNSAFTDLWQFEEGELSAEPHLSRIAATSAARIGRDSIWSMVSAGVTGGEPSRYGEWGRVTRADGRILSVSLTRLPLGATLVVFEDLTDIERFDAALRENPAAA